MPRNRDLSYVTVFLEFLIYGVILASCSFKISQSKNAPTVQ